MSARSFTRMSRVLGAGIAALSIVALVPAAASAQETVNYVALGDSDDQRGSGRFPCRFLPSQRVRTERTHSPHRRRNLVRLTLHPPCHPRGGRGFILFRCFHRVKNRLVIWAVFIVLLFFLVQLIKLEEVNN